MNLLIARTENEREQAGLRAAGEELEASRKHARETTDMLRDKMQEVERLRVHKGVDDREGTVKAKSLVAQVSLYGSGAERIAANGLWRYRSAEKGPQQVSAFGLNFRALPQTRHLNQPFRSVSALVFSLPYTSQPLDARVLRYYRSFYTATCNLSYPGVSTLSGVSIRFQRGVLRVVGSYISSPADVTVPPSNFTTSTHQSWVVNEPDEVIRSAKLTAGIYVRLSTRNGPKPTTRYLLPQDMARSAFSKHTEQRW
jgi:hypothetical protein